MPQTNEQIERRSLEVGKWGNLLMAVASVGAAFLSRSDALLEVAVTKIGRAHFVVTYVKPDGPVDGPAVDALWEELDSALRDLLGQAKTEIIIAARPPYEP